MWLCRLFLLVIFLSMGCLSAPPPYYTAAVVEYAPVTNGTDILSRAEATATQMINLAAYDALAQSAAMQGAQLVVFPEDCLYGIFGGFEGHPTREMVRPYAEDIPDPSSSLVPCTQGSPLTPVLNEASCIALRHRMIVVLTMADVKLDRFYNTLVVFAEDGSLVIRYHKEHLFMETQFDPGPPGQVTTFKSSFGVVFGVSICYDAMFDSPMVRNVAAGVTDFLYPLWWVNQPPILTGPVYQQQWSAKYQVNLLAASSGASWQYSGTGVYHRGRVLASFYNDDPSVSSTRLLVQRVPLVRRETPPLPPVSLRFSPAYAPPNITMLSVQEGRHYLMHSIHRRSLFCSASLAAASSGWLGLVSYSGLYYGTYYEELCALVACANATFCYDATWSSPSVFTTGVPLSSFSVWASGGLQRPLADFSLVLGADAASVLPAYQYARANRSLSSTDKFHTQTVMGASLFGVLLTDSK